MTEDFEIKFSDDLSIFIPVRKIYIFLTKLPADRPINITNHLDILSAIVKNPQKINIPNINDDVYQDLSQQIQAILEIHRQRDLTLIQNEFYEMPQKAFLIKGTDVINTNLITKWHEISNIVNIEQININTYTGEYEGLGFFIEHCSEFLPAFIKGLDEAVNIADKNQNKINFFLMKEQRHTFSLCIIKNNLFVFDSCGQRYGKTNNNFKFENYNNEYIHFDDIPYSAMFTKYLQENPNKKLFFNLNALQQDTTNCFTFSVDFIDGFCARISKLNGENKLEQFNDYLTSFFKVQLNEELQVFHEGAFDVLKSAITAENLDKDFRENRRQLLPSELLRTSQLSNIINAAKEISDVPFSQIKTFELNEEFSLEQIISRTSLNVFIREKDSSIIEKPINRRIYSLRNRQEEELERYIWIIKELKLNTFINKK